MRYTTISTIVLAFWVPSVIAQVPSTQPQEAASAATQPVKIDESFEARVLEVVGNVSYALTDAQGVAGQWQPAKVGDVLPAGTRLRTRLRSKVLLAFGEDTVVLVERATLASIDQFHRTGDTKRIKLGLGHGAIRAGVAETTLRSDMVIDTPTATLSKRGTNDFRIAYEPIAGRFRISLAREGLVDALNKLTGQTRTVAPGQYVTQEMKQWIETAKFDRHVAVQDTFSMTDTEKLFNLLQDSGLGVLEPGGGQQILTLSGRDAGRLAAELAAQRSLQIPGQIVPRAIIPGQAVIDRPEGNFGTGSGLLSTFSTSR